VGSGGRRKHGTAATRRTRRVQLGDHLVNAQRHLLQINHAEGQTFLGITFAKRSLGDTLSERLGGMFGKGVSDGERRRRARMVEQFDEVLGAFGMRGRRVTPAELEWLLYRSVALCMAPPTHLSAWPTASGSAATCSRSPNRSSGFARRTARRPGW